MIFLHPEYLYLLLLLILPVMIYFYSGNKFKKYFSKEVFNRLVINQSYLPHMIRSVLMILIFTLMVLSLARPVGDKENVSISLKGINIIIALDISKSMLAEDIKPNRMIVAKEKIRQFIDINSNNKMAIVAFAGNSFMVAPLSHDGKSLKFLISNLDTSSISQKGSSILSVLEATNVLNDKKELKNLIIFSDGGDKDDYNEEIKFAKKHKIAVSILAIGTRDGSPIRDTDGEFVLDKNQGVFISKRNDNIEKLALQSNGIFMSYTYSKEDIFTIKEHMEDISKSKVFKKNKALKYDEMFIYPLALAFVFVVISFWTFFKKTPIMILFSLLLYNTELRANSLDFMNIDNANSQYKKGDYKKAINSWLNLESDESEVSYNIANAYYKSKQYQKAIDYFDKVEFYSSQAKSFVLYNKANSYVKLKDYEKAKELYKESIKLNDDKNAKYNLKLLEDMKKKDDKKNQQDDKQDDKKKEKQKKDDKNKKGDKKKNDKGKKGDKKKKSENKNHQFISAKEEKKWLQKLNKQKSKVVPLYQFNNKRYKNESNW